MPTTAKSIASGVAAPAPLPAAPAPATSGVRNAAPSTGPMNPTDCATTSRKPRLLRRSRSLPAPASIAPPLAACLLDPAPDPGRRERRLGHEVRDLRDRVRER